MKKYLFIIVFAISTFSTSNLYAGELPEIIKSGFEAYKNDGPKAAIETWIKGSAMDGSKDALSQANMFRQIEDYYGSYVSYELFKTNPLGSSSKLYLITINYENGVLFAKYFTYKPKGKSEVTLSFKFHTEVDVVWPPSLVYGD